MHVDPTASGGGAGAPEPVDSSAGQSPVSRTPAQAQRRFGVGEPDDGLLGRLALNQIGKTPPPAGSPVRSKLPANGDMPPALKAEKAGGSPERVKLVTRLESLTLKHDVQAFQSDGGALVGSTGDVADLLLSPDNRRVAIVSNYAQIDGPVADVEGLLGFRLNTLCDELIGQGKQVTFMVPPRTRSDIIGHRTYEPGDKSGVHPRFMNFQGTPADSASAAREMLAHPEQYGYPPDLVISVDNKPRKK